ncbi:MAG: hypothetical protein KA206_09725 [Paludibacter sp.]|nr:hypothetical protein [Paludibacter sp.]
MRTILSLVIILCLCACNNKIQIDGNDSTEILCIKNNLHDTISSKLIGISEEEANQQGYEIEAVILPNSTVELFKEMVGFSSLNDYLDSIYIYDSHNNLILKKDVISFQRTAIRTVIDDKTCKFTFEVSDSLLNK